MSSLTSPWAVVDAAVDYLTVTTSHPERQAALYDLARRVQADEIAAGNERVAWGLKGYVGEHAGGTHRSSPVANARLRSRRHLEGRGAPRHRVAA